jgi:hypothetical protein
MLAVHENARAFDLARDAVLDAEIAAHEMVRQYPQPTSTESAMLNAVLESIAVLRQSLASRVQRAARTLR